MLQKQRLLSYPNYYYTINEHLLLSNLSSDTKFYDKFEALNYKNTLPNAEIYINWFDDVWQNIDYTIEPKQSFAELKKQRAQKIRDKYSYVKLWFSGGVDSFTALNAFLDNNIHIDEIAFWSRPVNSFKFVDPDNEIKAAVEPYLKQIQPLIPNTKITRYEMNFNHIANKSRTIYDKGTDTLISGKEPELELVPEFRELYNMLDWQSNGVNVEGGIKPTLALINGQWYFYINDKQMCLYDQFEDFFFDPEDPILYLKTLHGLAKHVNSFNFAMDQLKNYSNRIDKFENKTKFLSHIGRQSSFDPIAMIKHVLPFGAIPTVKINNNLKINFFHVRNAEIIRAVKDQDGMSDIIKNWLETVDYFNKEYKNDVTQNINGTPDAARGFKPIFSKFYNLNNKNDFKWHIYNPANKIYQNTVLENDIIRISPS